MMINLFANSTRHLILTFLLGLFVVQDNLVSQVIADFDFDQDCSIVQFNDLTTVSGVAIVTGRLWNFGDGNISTLENPEHNYFSENSYSVEMRVYYEDGGEIDSVSVFHPVHFFIPVAAFSAIDVCFGTATDFSSAATTGPNTFINPDDMLWDFENTGIYTATGTNVSHTFGSPGFKPVNFMVTNNVGCVDDAIQFVEVFQNPVAAFTYNPACPGNETFFYDASAPNALEISSWIWNFGDGSPGSNLENPGHIYLGNGNYAVNLLVTNSNGCYDDTTQTLIIERPDANFDYDVVCAGMATSFTDLSVFSSLQLTSWQWDFGVTGGNSSIQNPQYTYESHGVYDVTLIVGNEMGCFDTIVQSVLVDSLPLAYFTNTVSCAGIQTCFTDLSVPNAAGITSWNWSFGDGSSSILQNPCHIYSDTGTFQVALTVINSNGCLSDPFEAIIYVAHEPLAMFEATGACFGNETFFANLTDTMGIEIDYWLWEFDDPASGNENTSGLFEPVHLFTSPGSYQVKLTVENIYGCSSTVQQLVYVHANPEAMFISPDTIALGVQFTITDQSSGSGSPIINRFWDFGDGNTAVNINPVIHDYEEPGGYMICLEVENIYGCSHLHCDSIIVTGLPTAEFVYASDITFETFFFDESQPDNTIINWMWDFGDPSSSNDTISGIPNPMWQYPEEGWYTVQLKIFDKYGGTDEISKMVYAGNAVMADFENYAVCQGDTTFFIDYSYSPVSAGFETWYWDFGDGYDTTYTEPVDTIRHRYILPGEYEVKFAVSANVSGFFMSDTLVQTIQIFERPFARIKEENLGVCFGYPIHFKDASVYVPGDPGSQWFWDFDDGSYSSSKNPVHHYNDTGTFQVIMQIMTENGCIGVDTAFAYVNFTPAFGFEVKNNCLNSPAQFIPLYDTTKLTITSWFWNFGDYLNPGNTSTQSSPYHTYTKINMYEVTMKMEAYGCPGEFKQTFLVYPTPYSDFDVTPNYEGIQGRTKFDNNSVLSTNYFWDFGNGNTSTVENPIEVFEFDSTYTITLISYNEYACSDTSRYTMKVFFKGLYFPTAFSPNNPNREISEFAPKGINLREFNVQVFDLKGNLMWESDALDENGSPSESWNGYSPNGILMPQGMYVWKAQGTFRDGLPWRGQTFDGEEPKTSGVVTLIH
jgi:PKD repeat protein